MIEECIIDQKTLDTLLESVVADNGDMSFDQFSNLVNVLDEFSAADEEEEEMFFEAMEGGRDRQDQSQGGSAEMNDSNDYTFSDEEDSEEDFDGETGGNGFGVSQRNIEDMVDEMDDMGFESMGFEGELDEATIEQITRDVYNELKGKSKDLSVRKFREWEGIRELVETGQIKRSAVGTALKEAGVSNKGSISFDQFQEIMDALDRELDETFEEAVEYERYDK